MQQRKWVRAIALFLAVLMLGGVLIQMITLLLAGAADNSDLSALQQKIDSLAKEKSQLAKQKKSVQNEKDSWQKEKSALEKDINSLNAEIEDINAEIEALNQNIAEKEMEIEQLQLQVDAQTYLYLHQIREIHERGPTELLDVLFGSGNLTDFLTQKDRAEELSQYQQGVINSLKLSKQSVLETKAEIELAKAVQENLRAEAHNKRGEMEGKQNKVNGMISDANADLTKLAKLINENEKEEERLNNELEKLLRALRSEYVGGNFIWPTPKYGRITDDYGMRIHPITKKEKMHTGIDIAAAGGTEILASNSGTVVVAEYNSSWGNYCVIDHGGGIATLYAHMQKAALVKVGATVSRGQKIGIVGSTGLSTGNHLHFEFRLNGKHTSPYNYVSKP